MTVVELLAQRGAAHGDEGVGSAARRAHCSPSVRDNQMMLELPLAAPHTAAPPPGSISDDLKRAPRVLASGPTIRSFGPDAAVTLT